ncbi:MAG: hypothetical protein L0Z62_47640 [Gemmataceae bacterium]|nr:hypothetical protein [Gemmataceae bacterium]
MKPPTRTWRVPQPVQDVLYTKSSFARGPLIDLRFDLRPDPEVELVAVSCAPTPPSAADPRFETLRVEIDRLCRKAQCDGHTLCSARIEFTRVWLSDRFLTPDEIRQAAEQFAVIELFGELREEPYTARYRPLPPLAAGLLTADVVRLARGIRASAAFDGLPALADALEDAGCDESLMLEHLRTCADHAPSCWAVEMILHGADNSCTPLRPAPA